MPYFLDEKYWGEHCMVHPSLARGTKREEVVQAVAGCLRVTQPVTHHNSLTFCQLGGLSDIPTMAAGRGQVCALIRPSTPVPSARRSHFLPHCPHLARCDPENVLSTDQLLSGGRQGLKGETVLWPGHGLNVHRLSLKFCRQLYVV